jgi:hypothetical protein
MTGPRLSVEQRRALVMLATAGRDGMTQSSLTTLGFGANVIAGLVQRRARDPDAFEGPG